MKSAHKIWSENVIERYHLGNQRLCCGEH